MKIRAHSNKKKRWRTFNYLIHSLKNRPKDIVLPIKPIITLISKQKKNNLRERKTIVREANPMLMSILAMAIIYAKKRMNKATAPPRKP